MEDTFCRVFDFENESIYAALNVLLQSNFLNIKSIIYLLLINVTHLGVNSIIRLGLKW